MVSFDIYERNGAKNTRNPVAIYSLNEGKTTFIGPIHMVVNFCELVKLFCMKHNMESYNHLSEKTN